MTKPKGGSPSKKRSSEKSETAKPATPVATGDAPAPTEKDAAVLVAIEKHCDEKGYSPTLRELSVAVGESISMISIRVRKLAAVGKVHVEPRIARSVRVV